jgi:hypothetical protein
LNTKITTTYHVGNQGLALGQSQNAAVLNDNFISDSLLHKEYDGFGLHFLVEKNQ